MTVAAILAPVFVQVLLTFALLFWMGQARFAAARAGEVTPSKGSPRTFGWPQKAQQVSDSFHNQLELPLLFYALVPLAMLTRKADLLFVLMSWVFVALRALHAFEHTGPNTLKRRFGLYGAGAIVLMVMWGVFAVRILTGL
jgi:hypothetical protein